jgi:hypothetical protein
MRAFGVEQDLVGRLFLVGSPTTAALGTPSGSTSSSHLSTALSGAVTSAPSGSVSVIVESGSITTPVIVVTTAIASISSVIVCKEKNQYIKSSR